MGEGGGRNQDLRRRVVLVERNEGVEVQEDTEVYFLSNVVRTQVPGMVGPVEDRTTVESKVKVKTTNERHLE